ncbi:MAG: hypothetical protein IJS94_07310, partial [Clostridia bacterium]|nr:hypothetical protein [Clostridia bacterium]
MRDLLVKARFDSKTIIRTEDIKPAVKRFLRKYNISENDISSDVASIVLTQYINDSEYGYNAVGSTDYLEDNNRALDSLVADIMDKATAEDETFAQYSGLRNYLRDIEITVPYSIVYDFGEKKDFAAFRRSLFGAVPHIKTVSAYDANIDTVYTDFSNEYPELFPADITAEADQLKKIAEVAQQLKSQTVPYFEETSEDVSDALKSELFGIVFEEWHGRKGK